MAAPSLPDLSHVGIFVRDIERMLGFYTTVFGLKVTDRGVGRVFRNELVFLSANREHHHQLVLASGRPEEATFSTVMQLSFKVGALDDLRRIRSEALLLGATKLRGMNHGNAWSIYFADPEGNTVEVYLDTPFHVSQPHADDLDLDLADADILRETERICRADPSFLPREEWERRFANTLA